MKPVPTLRRFDDFLATRGLRLDAVVVGGSALALLGITNPDWPTHVRATLDDLLGTLRHGV